MKVITFDLDNTIFDTTPAVFEAFRRHNTKPFLSKEYDMYKAYPKEIAEECSKLFYEDIWYNTKPIVENTDTYINSLNSKYKIYFVTYRHLAPERSLEQLHSNNIHCNIDQVLHVKGSKTNILKELNSYIHFDDSPYVISDCIYNNIPVHMISNELTPYNHHLRDSVNYSINIIEALKRTLINEYGE